MRGVAGQRCVDSESNISNSMQSGKNIIFGQSRQCNSLASVTICGRGGDRAVSR